MNDPIYRVDTEEQVVYLTFDDGPYIRHDLLPGGATSNATTEEMLDMLADLRDNVVGDPGLSATFFVNGWAFVKGEPNQGAPEETTNAFAQERRRVATRMLAEGHDLANHSQHHLNPWGLPAGLDTVEEMVQEINLTQAAMELIERPAAPVAGAAEVGTIRPYFRSPGDPSYELGKRPARPLWGNSRAPEAAKQRFRKVVTAAQQAGLRYTSFNIWAKDNEEHLPPEDVYWHVIDVSHWNRTRTQDDTDLLSFEDLANHTPFTRRGAIILMHSGRQHAVTALGPFGGFDGIIPHIYDAGFVVRKLPELEAP